jgi:nickel/cobalt transporter (NicO) family protein
MVRGTRSASVTKLCTCSPPRLKGERLGEGLFLISLAALFLVFACSLPALAQTAPNPFAIGGLEGAGGKPTNAVVAFILSKQAEFTRAMTLAARAVRTDWSALWSLIGLAFTYGVFHAAGPGHGKAIVASYIVANENALKRGATVATLAAVLQGVVAIVLVAVIALILQGTRQTMTGAVNTIETISYAAIAAFGFWLLVRKIRSLLLLRTGGSEACDHFHMPAPGEVMNWSTKDTLAAIFAAGLRPCSGAVLILIFTLSQGVFWAGIAAVAAMSAGTALTTSGIAAMAVYFKALAVRMASGRGQGGTILVRCIEIIAACAVLVLGLTLLSGHWASMGGA